MSLLTSFSVRNLRQRFGELLRNAEHGRPTIERASISVA